MSMRSLTRKESVILALIQDRIVSQQPCPSLQEMAETMGMRSRSGPHRLVNGLIEKGFLTRKGHGLRLVELPDAGPPVAIVEKEVVRHVLQPVPVAVHEPVVSPHLVLDPIRESMLGHEGATVNSRNYKKTLKPEDLLTAIAAIPEVTRGLRTYDWALLGTVITDGSSKEGAMGRRRRSRRLSSSSSAHPFTRKDDAVGSGRSPPITGFRSRPDQKPLHAT